MNVLSSKPQINLKNHISNKNKGESIRYCPKITVPNTLALSQLKMMDCRQKFIWDARKDEGIIRICWVMPDSFFDI